MSLTQTVTTPYLCCGDDDEPLLLPRDHGDGDDDNNGDDRGPLANCYLLILLLTLELLLW